jgi:hypothetical protein
MNRRASSSKSQSVGRSDIVAAAPRARPNKPLASLVVGSSWQQPEDHAEFETPA